MGRYDLEWNVIAQVAVLRLVPTASGLCVGRKPRERTMCGRARLDLLRRRFILVAWSTKPDEKRVLRVKPQPAGQKS